MAIGARHGAVNSRFSSGFARVGIHKVIGQQTIERARPGQGRVGGRQARAAAPRSPPPESTV